MGDIERRTDADESRHYILNRVLNPGVEIDHFSNFSFHTFVYGQVDSYALDRFKVHRCPTRRVFSGTGLELGTRQASVRYLYHSATAASIRLEGDNNPKDGKGMDKIQKTPAEPTLNEMFEKVSLLENGIVSSEVAADDYKVYRVPILAHKDILKFV
ncbi:hypothetical protein TNCV_3432571 [Trichonephila clavipes]|nr:hypothetical protein TNCV_3432571 [Trichonephila clavipes]